MVQGCEGGVGYDESAANYGTQFFTRLKGVPADTSRNNLRCVRALPQLRRNDSSDTVVLAISSLQLHSQTCPDHLDNLNHLDLDNLDHLDDMDYLDRLDHLDNFYYLDHPDH